MQTVLTFQTCPSPVATSYLHGLCVAEGYFPDRDYLAGLYESADDPFRLSVESTSRSPDLRRAIHSLQLWCPARHGVPPHEYPQTHLWEYLIADTTDSIRRSEASHAELVSFVDGHLTRNGIDASEVCSHCLYPWGVSQSLIIFDHQVFTMRSCKACSDDEIGHPIMHEAPDDDFDIHDRAEMIASTAMRYSHGVVKVGIVSRPLPPPPRALFRSRVYDEMIDLWANHPALSVALTRGSALHTDYVPAIRHIVVGEDLQAGVPGQPVQGSRRTTRSKQGHFSRSIWMEETERGKLMDSELR